jgi:hypothetical protein
MIIEVSIAASGVFYEIDSLSTANQPPAASNAVSKSYKDVAI